ncbi:hypothetical protein [Pontibacter mangrovi]|uniref:Uncharacterized protein n=1 Tax=Pontibacter mangrovi TaxID=2589816 RepID=A0A501W9J7_9BACT|nr:hypothetical protein [Pontibacter mangrovi]TPE43951.1 hypothetical protein FJM65_11035 [Pontibacter mangrovi]
MILSSQQLEISHSEGMELCRQIVKYLSKEITSPEDRLTPFEVLAATQLQKVYAKLIRRISKQTKISKFKITLTAPELIAIHEIINDYPVELYNILSQVDRKVLNYEQVVDFNYASNL